MVEQCFLLRWEMEAGSNECGNITPSTSIYLYSLLKIARAASSGITSGFKYPASLFLYFNNFLISSIRISLSGWYFPVSIGVLPSGSP